MFLNLLANTQNKGMIAGLFSNPILIVVIVFLLILIAYIIYAFKTKHWPF